MLCETLQLIFDGTFVMHVYAVWFVFRLILGRSFFFFFKQKTAYEIYQCDWSSDVCSSDLVDSLSLQLVPCPRVAPGVDQHGGCLTARLAF